MGGTCPGFRSDDDWMDDDPWDCEAEEPRLRRRDPAVAAPPRVPSADLPPAVSMPESGPVPLA